MRETLKTSKEDKLKQRIKALRAINTSTLSHTNKVALAEMVYEMETELEDILGVI